MPTWKKVIVSGNNAHLTSITASQVPTGTTENVLLISATGEVKQVSQATLTGASVLSFVTMSVSGLGGSTGTVFADSAADNLTISSEDGNITITATAGTDTLSFDFADSPIFTHITASGNISGSGNLSITGNETIGGTSTITGRLTANGAITTTNITASGGATIGTTLAVGTNATVGGNLTVSGDLTVSGTTTVIDTTNLSVEDKFIILAHGSGSISPIQEGGIIIEGSTADSGQAFVFNSGSTADVTGRWGIAANVHATSSDVTPTEFMVSAITTAGVPSTAPTYGGSNGGYGNIHVNSADQSIWIYS